MAIFDKDEKLIARYPGIVVSQIVSSIVYISINLVLYFYYSSLVDSRKNQIANDYYQIILNNSVLKLENLLQKFPFESNNHNTINVSNSDITICNKKFCNKHNLVTFASSIEKNVPSFINYKIEINKQLLQCNNKIHSNYELEKTTYIDKNNQVTVGISLDQEYLQNLKTQTIKPFIIIFFFITLVLVTFFWSIKFLDIKIKEFFSIFWENFYNTKLKSINKRYNLNLKKERVHYKNILQEKENSLMKRIWSLEYGREKDLELNYLFSVEANKLAIITQKIDCLDKGYILNKKVLPCSLMLYNQENKKEKIHIKNFVNVQ